MAPAFGIQASDKLDPKAHGVVSSNAVAGSQMREFDELAQARNRPWEEGYIYRSGVRNFLITFDLHWVALGGQRFVLSWHIAVLRRPMSCLFGHGFYFHPGIILYVPWRLGFLHNLLKAMAISVTSYLI